MGENPPLILRFLFLQANTGRWMSYRASHLSNLGTTRWKMDPSRQAGLRCHYSWSCWGIWLSNYLWWLGRALSSLLLLKNFGALCFAYIRCQIMLNLDWLTRPRVNPVASCLTLQFSPPVPLLPKFSTRRRKTSLPYSNAILRYGSQAATMIEARTTIYRQIIAVDSCIFIVNLK